jgi:hypothetical protein
MKPLAADVVARNFLGRDLLNLVLAAKLDIDATVRSAG